MSGALVIPADLTNHAPLFGSQGTCAAPCASIATSARWKSASHGPHGPTRLDGETDLCLLKPVQRGGRAGHDLVDLAGKKEPGLAHEGGFGTNLKQRRVPTRMRRSSALRRTSVYAITRR